jgi:hypothetical protein
MIKLIARRSSGCLSCADGGFLTFCTVVSLFFSSSLLQAQPPIDTAYVRVLKERSSKIVSALRLNDAERELALTRLMVGQYLAVNEIHDRYTPAPKPVDSVARIQWGADKQRMSEQKVIALHNRHDLFLQDLSGLLDAAGVEAVKDGMTYRVLPITYAAYLDMLPGLTDAQRSRIMDWLREARELAMDEGSSNAKHAVFGKYKGRINNYLSAQGYDLKKETEAWQQRIKQRNITK